MRIYKIQKLILFTRMRFGKLSYWIVYSKYLYEKKYSLNLLKLLLFFLVKCETRHSSGATGDVWFGCGFSALMTQPVRSALLCSPTSFTSRQCHHLAHHALKRFFKKALYFSLTILNSVIKNLMDIMKQSFLR